MSSSKSRRALSSIARLLFDGRVADPPIRPIVPTPALSLPGTGTDLSAITVGIGSSVHAFPNGFLRDACRCHRCVDPSTAQKTFNTADLPTDVTPRAVRIANGSLEVIWRGADAHRSVYPASFLATHSDSAETARFLHNDRPYEPWDDEIIRRKDIWVEYQDYMRSEEAVARVTRNLVIYGLAFLRNAPTDEKNLTGMINRIGPLKTTFYGPTWNVRSVENAKNIAYTNVNLDLHMDLLYFESPPGLQFLHCLENRVTGGSSIFVDSFLAVEVMRKEHPEAFKVLCNYNVDFHYKNDGQHYHQAKPTIVLDPQTGAVQFVNYSPPFQDTLNPEGFAAFHSAIAILGALIKAKGARYEFTLKEGDCAIFNNRRVLHARRAFGPGARWLKGGYADIDCLYNKWRVMQSAGI